MFTFICFIFFAGFLCLMNTSKRISWPEKNNFLRSLGTKLNVSRYLAAVLFLIATILSVIFLGVGSGIFGAIVMLMTAGCLSVFFFPFRYVGTRGIVFLFIVCFALEQLF